MIYWDGKQHVLFDWNLFKSLCQRYGATPIWEMDNRINYPKRVNEVLEMLK